MRAWLRYDPGHRHQLEAMGCLSKGLARHGWHVDLAQDYGGAERADFVACWGDKLPAALRERPYLILEAGYINGQSGDYVRDRLRFVSVGWNGLHGRAGPGPSGCPPDRFLATGAALAPWRKAPLTRALICDQHPGDRLAAEDRGWWRPLSDDLAGRGVRVTYRPHPLMTERLRPLRESLGEADLCVTWSSTAGVEAVLAGVPTIAMDRGSMVWDVSSRSLDEPTYRGAREQWAYDLAYRQWSHEELADGSAWEHAWGWLR